MKEPRSEPVGEKREKKTQKSQPHVEVPPVDMILRYPIEVWVSSGEAFCKPESEYRCLSRVYIRLCDSVSVWCLSWSVA